MLLCHKLGNVTKAQIRLVLDKTTCIISAQGFKRNSQPIRDFQFCFRMGMSSSYIASCLAKSMQHNSRKMWWDCHSSTGCWPTRITAMKSTCFFSTYNESIHFSCRNDRYCLLSASHTWGFAVFLCHICNNENLISLDFGQLVGQNKQIEPCLWENLYFEAWNGKFMPIRSCCQLGMVRRVL